MSTRDWDYTLECNVFTNFNLIVF